MRILWTYAMGRYLFDVVSLVPASDLCSSSGQRFLMADLRAAGYTSLGEKPTLQ
jgi:hypothetical protein